MSTLVLLEFKRIGVKECIARRLKEARFAFGISQRQLGILAGIDEQSASARMNQYETGKHVPNFLTLERIGKVLGYPIEYFFSEDDITAQIIFFAAQLPEPEKQRMLNTIKEEIQLMGVPQL